MYTIKQLAKTAGVTVKTIRHYEKVGLLQPALRKENGYRYYDHRSVLLLQQILLYRKADVPVKEIKRLMQEDSFAIEKSLSTHKANLQRKIKQLQEIVETIDKTKFYIKGEIEMSTTQLFKGLTKEEEQIYKEEATQKFGAEVEKSYKKWNSYSKYQKEQIGKEGNQVYIDFVKAIDKGATSQEAQDCVKRWRKHMEYFWTPNEQQLVALAKGYNDDARFKATFDKIDPRLALFIYESVKVAIDK